MATVDYSQLLKIKQETLSILLRRGYDIGDEETLLEMTPEEFASEYIERIETEGGISELQQSILQESKDSKKEKKRIKEVETKIDPRFAMTNAYRLIANPANMILVYFAPIPSGTKSMGSAEFESFSQLMVKLRNEDEDSTDYYVCNAGIFVTPLPFSSDANNKFSHVHVPSYRWNTLEEYPLNGYFIQWYLDDDLMYDPFLHNLTPKSFRILSPKEAAKFKAENHLQAHKLPQRSATDAIMKRLGACVDDIVEIENELPLEGTMMRVEKYYVAVFHPPTEKKK
jgi:DNA-directed RNA polymerase subunit H (RpoH/RPB5)